jgi:hypothetical protein
VSAFREDICTRLRRGVPHPDGYDQPSPPYDIGAADVTMAEAADLIDALLERFRDAVHEGANKARRLGIERYRETIKAERLEAALTGIVLFRPSDGEGDPHTQIAVYAKRVASEVTTKE